MHNLRQIAWCLLLLLSGPALLHGEAHGTGWATCAVNLVLPRFGPASRVAGSGGPVVATFNIDRNGYAVQLKLSGGEDQHRSEVSTYLRESKFAPRCAGRTLEMRFSFVINGEALLYPTSWVEFESPNHFSILTRPVKPSIN